jgi:hypothetical protein
MPGKLPAPCEELQRSHTVAVHDIQTNITLFIIEEIEEGAPGFLI